MASHVYSMIGFVGRPATPVSGWTLWYASVLLLALGWAAAPAWAQDVPLDSIPSYRRPLDTMRVDMAELTVDAEAAAVTTGPGAVRVDAAALAAVPATSLADVAPLLPGAVVQINSRGETLLYLRGAGERQTLLLLDGAPLTIPWDRRIDLGLVPALALGRVEALAGPAALAAGPDALGGAVRFQTRRLATDGQFYEAEASGRLPAAGRAGGVGLGKRGRFGWMTAFQLVGDEGLPVADGARLPFSQHPDGRRTNTDRQSASGAVRLGWAGSAWQGALAVLGAANGAGVAPEGHLDPAESRVRYWQRPDRRFGLAVLNVRRPGPALTLGATLWAGGFAQTIEQYPDRRYRAPASEQEDRDAWTGARLRAERYTPLGRFAITGRSQIAAHREREREDGAAFGPDPLYRQLDLGLLADWRGTAGGVDLQAGTRYDRLALLGTGDKPGRDDFQALSGFGSASLAVGSGWTALASVGRAARFPTLRELFGVALGRFAESPGLKAERAWTAEMGTEHVGSAWSGRVVGFGRWTTDAIEQETLPDDRRRRINLGGTRAVGVETQAAWRPLRAVRVDGHLTLQHVRQDGGGRLPEKPVWIGRASLAWAPPLGLNGRLDGQWTGGAVGPDAEGALVPLDDAPRLDVRLGYKRQLFGTLADVYLRLDNAFDAAYEPQLGLPVPGRSASLGLRLFWTR